MDYYATTVQNKMAKVESSLLELNNEILIGVKFLLSLKEDAAEIVKNLNRITTPATYLQEFMNVNSFILKYLSFLTEINCKFEILNITEKKFKSSISRSKAITSVEVSEILARSDSEYKSKGDLTSKTVREKVLIDEPSESDSNANQVNHLPVKKSKKKKLRKTVTGQGESARKNNSLKVSANVTASSNSNNKDSDDTNKTVNDIDTSFSSDHSLSIPKIDDKMLKPESIYSSDNKISDVKDDFNSTRLFEVNDQKTNITETLQINSEQKSLVEISPTKSFDLTNFNTDKIMGNGTHLTGDIPMAEVVPTRIQADNLESSIETSSIKCAEEDLEATQPFNLKEGKNEEDCIKPEKLSRIIGEEYNVNIEHIKSPSEFYVSISHKPSSLLCELEEKLKLFTLNKAKNGNKRFENKSLLSKEIGTYALFYSKCDEIWCRVKITNWCLNFSDDFVTAFLLDYGETKCVSIDDLCPMPEYFKKYPTFIYRCHLQGIIPFETEKNSDTLSWEKASSEKMKSLTENSKSVKIKIGPEDQFHPSTSLPVTLWLVDEGNQCVNELLVQSKYAVWSSDQVTVKTSQDNMRKREEKGSCITENENLEDWDPMKEDFESYLNSYELDMNDPASVIYGYVGKDYDRICMHFANTGFCFKGMSCRKEHQKLDPLGLTTDKEEVYKDAFNSLPVPPPKSVLNVQVTCLLKFNQFFCISENNSLPSFEENLQTLLKGMNTAENVQDMKKLLVPPSAGQIVLACYSEDHCWYRARILESQPERDLYTVAFVDYGNTETMPLSKIRAIEPRYLHLPFQAMQCFIFGVERNPKVPLKAVMDYMNDKINDGHVSIEVIASLPGEYVNLLVNVFDQNGRNLGEELIQKKYAIPKQEMVVSAESESVPG